MHNDDFTPMEFVVHVLEDIFHRTPAEATRIMLLVHRTGLGIAGVYSHEVAEAKAMTTIRLARDSGYPLLVTTEPE
jgi:ATP-dependent Clp protease adaptor protein ClpS